MLGTITRLDKCAYLEMLLLASVSDVYEPVGVELVHAVPDAGHVGRVIGEPAVTLYQCQRDARIVSVHHLRQVAQY